MCFDLLHLPSLSVGLGCLLSCYLPVVTLSAILLLSDQFRLDHSGLMRSVLQKHFLAIPGLVWSVLVWSRLLGPRSLR